MEYMHAHLTESVRIEDVAAAAGLSPFHFARLFRSTTGITPHRYLMLARVERAKAMLLQCDRTMTEIATEAGFSDQSHMSKVFRRLMGCSPTRFRAASVAFNHQPFEPVRRPAPAALDKVPAPANT
jgi:AraC family transcriptional regulator